MWLFKKKYARPKTVGELLENLKKGISCEVVASKQEVVSIYLDGWLHFEGKYKVKPPRNTGWVIFEAIK